jgi:hypothetical protein
MRRAAELLSPFSRLRRKPQVSSWKGIGTCLLRLARWALHDPLIRLFSTKKPLTSPVTRCGENRRSSHGCSLYDKALFPKAASRGDSLVLLRSDFSR